jgi:hypothetical protein
MDKNLVAFDQVRFELLSAAFDQARSEDRMDALEALCRRETVMSPETMAAFEAVRSAGSVSESITLSNAVAGDLGARLFWSLCRPFVFGLTKSSFTRYLYERSPYIQHLFAGGGLTGSSMDLYLGLDGIRLHPDKVKQMWAELSKTLPSDLTIFNSSDVEDLREFGARLDKDRFENVGLVYM